MILEKVNNPKDLKKLSIKEKNILASEIRNLIIDVVSKNGGHLASNLGVVELTIAMHSVYNAPKDKIVFDVGHQSYVHKILTGRKDRFNTLRKLNGISGFPKTRESIYDTFNTGHSSTSISAASGIARSRDISKEKYEVVALIGDGSLTGGMALEALNDVGSSNLNMTVILNDNEMSISKNVGGIPLLLSRLRTRKLYTSSNRKIKNIVSYIPILGKLIIKLVQGLKRLIKQIFIKNMYFEDIGFTYLGPVDGHNIEKLEDILKRAKAVEGPVLIHVITKKGKGYKYAEECPDIFHSTGPFNIETGLPLKEKDKDYSKVFGDKLVKLARKDKRIVAVTAAMKDGTGLSEFAKIYPNRFFDVGIAEQHALGLISGLSISGLKPVLPIYSSFLQRGYDQLLHDIALQNLDVTICIDRAGLVGNDGETHHGIFDLSYTSHIPNLIIMAPKNFRELEDMLEFSLSIKGPKLIRYPRGTENTNIKTSKKIELGKSEIISKGEDICIIAIGNMVARAIEVKEKLKDISIEVVNVRFLKPIDSKGILNSIKNKKLVVTLEDNIKKGGLSDSVLELINDNNLNKKVLPFGYDSFITQGTISELEKKYKIDSDSIVKKIKEEYFK